MWAINDVVSDTHAMPPILRLKRNQSYILRLHNRSRFRHPMHLHSHYFHVLSRNGKPSPYGKYQDTVITSPEEVIEIGLVTDTPGKWMFHCHILAHQKTGISSLVEVS